MKTTFGEESNVLFNFFYRSSLFQFDAFFYGLLIPLIKINSKKLIFICYTIFVLLLISTQIYSAIQISNTYGYTFLESIAIIL
jgi:hypothetical protein